MRGWCRERWVPLTASALFVVVGYLYAVTWAGLPTGPFDVWLTPSDLWGTWLEAAKLVHGHLSGYGTNPGPVLLLVPVAAPGHALGLQVGPEFSSYFAPSGWLLAGPYTLAVSCIAIFAADSLARDWRLSGARRLALGLAEAAVLSNVALKWGHPEDAVAIGLVLFAVGQMRRRRWSRIGWLVGVAALAQPFALLAVPALVVVAWQTPGGNRADAWRVLWRAGVPYAVALIPALIFAWGTTTRWMLHQPNWPALNHPTPFTSLASPVPGSLGGVSSGPGRLVALGMAVLLAVVMGRLRPADERMALWTIAASFTVWVGTESVIASYYVWPALALGLALAASCGGARLGVGIVLSGIITWFGNATWHGVWPWWSLTMGLLVVMLVVAWPAGRTAGAHPEPSEKIPHSAAS